MDKRKSKDKSTTKKSKISRKVVDLSAYREEKNEERRREYERVLFHKILGVYSFAEFNNKIHNVEVLDISYSGILFRELHPQLPSQPGSKVALRFYFTPSSYLRLVVEVKRTRPFKSGGRQGLEYGCELDKSTRSYEVLRQLVQFMYKYAEIACQDATPPMIWF
ncbi:PilZ domain-containing protein [bacterium]|nr:PilZ domain-containing protein [bacterium]